MSSILLAWFNSLMKGWPVNKLNLWSWLHMRDGSEYNAYHFRVKWTPSRVLGYAGLHPHPDSLKHLTTASCWPCYVQRISVKYDGLEMNIDYRKQTGNYMFMFPLFYPSLTKSQLTPNHMSVAMVIMRRSMLKLMMQTVYSDNNKSYVGIWGTSVSIETGLRARRQGFDSRQGQRWNFFSRHCFQSGSGTQQTSYPIGAGGKAAGT
jgi:hypothetical protein